MKFTLATLLLWLPSVLFAQVEFRGRVLDATSKSGVPNASVFLTGTTVGISTDEQGFFSMRIPDGNYEAVVRLVGYLPRVFAVSTLEINPDGYQIMLNPSYGELDHLEVEGKRDPVWLENLELFKQYFLGNSENGKDSRIINQIILRLDSDSDPLSLQVTAPDVLQIDNPNLGYRLEYLLEEFTYSLRSQTFYYGGYSRFVVDSTLTWPRGKRLEANRRKAYLGSIQHLIRSLYEGTAEEEGFEFRSIERINNPSRPDQQLIDDAKAKFAQSTDPDEKDSLYRNFIRKERLSSYIDRLISTLVPGSVLVTKDLKGHSYLTFDRLLHVTYTKEAESDEYLNQLPPRRPGWQQSILRIESGPVEIFPNGTYGNRSGIFLEGYMGWEKVGELMPLDYRPKPSQYPTNSTQVRQPLQ